MDITREKKVSETSRRVRDGEISSADAARIIEDLDNEVDCLTNTIATQKGRRDKTENEKWCGCTNDGVDDRDSGHTCDIHDKISALEDEVEFQKKQVQEVQRTHEEQVHSLNTQIARVIRERDGSEAAKQKARAEAAEDYAKRLALECLDENGLRIGWQERAEAAEEVNAQLAKDAAELRAELYTEKERAERYARLLENYCTPELFEAIKVRAEAAESRVRELLSQGAGSCENTKAGIVCPMCKEDKTK